MNRARGIRMTAVGGTLVTRGCLVLLVGWFVFRADPVRAAGVVGNGTPASCTEDAIAAAMVGGGLVTFNCGPAPVTITVTQATGGFANSDSTIVDGGGRITLSGGNGFRLFTQHINGTLILRNIRLTRGRASDGGCIFTESTVLLVAVVLDRCEATDDGGAVYATERGTLEVTNSSITDNVAGSDGGGIFFRGAEVYGTSLAVADTTLARNRAGATGGAIHHVGFTLAAARVLYLDNTAGLNGGGLFVCCGARGTVTSSTFSGNVAVNRGAAIHYEDYGGGAAALSLVNLTLSSNLPAASALTAIADNPSRVVVTNSIFDAQGCFQLWFGDIGSGGFNIRGVCVYLSAATDRAIDPRLGPLSDNGGPTLTHRLLADSPAIDQGTGLGCPASDQRGVPRPQGDACDIGAYEVAHYDLSTSHVAPAAQYRIGDAIPFSIRISNLGAAPAHGIVVTDVLPAGLSLVSLTASQGACSVATVSCTVGSLASGAAADVQVVATAAEPGTLTSSASVQALDLDTDLTNNAALAQVDVAALPPPPSEGLTIQLNGTAYHPGRTMTVAATLAPISARVQVDAYVVVQLPTGQFLSLQLGGALVPGIVPIARNFVPFPYQGQIGQYTFTGAEPPGTYTWFSALTRPGTLEIVGALGQNPFGFSR